VASAAGGGGRGVGELRLQAMKQVRAELGDQRFKELPKEDKNRLVEERLSELLVKGRSSE
jgi:hypothetical protein